MEDLTEADWISNRFSDNPKIHVPIMEWISEIENIRNSDYGLSESQIDFKRRLFYRDMLLAQIFLIDDHEQSDFFTIQRCLDLRLISACESALHRYREQQKEKEIAIFKIFSEFFGSIKEIFSRLK